MQGEKVHSTGLWVLLLCRKNKPSSKGCWGRPGHNFNGAIYIVFRDAAVEPRYTPCMQLLQLKTRPTLGEHNHGGLFARTCDPLISQTAKAQHTARTKSGYAECKSGTYLLFIVI